MTKENFTCRRRRYRNWALIDTNILTLGMATKTTFTLLDICVRKINFAIHTSTSYIYRSCTISRYTLNTFVLLESTYNKCTVSSTYL